MRKVQQAVMLVMVLALLVSCSSSGQKALVVSGTSIQSVGEQFVVVTEQVTAGCKAQTIPQDTCTRYAAFGVQFKKTYPLAVGLWKAARASGDVAAQKKAEDVIVQLAGDLTKLATEALVSFGVGGK